VSSSKSADLARGESNWFTRAVEDASSWSHIGVSARHNSAPEAISKASRFDDDFRKMQS